MANCMATCRGSDKNRDKTEIRLGSEAAEGMAQTWRTQGRVVVRKDGSGYFELRDLHASKTLFTYEFGPESERA